MSRKSDLQFLVNPLFSRFLLLTAPPPLHTFLPMEKLAGGVERFLPVSSCFPQHFAALKTQFACYNMFHVFATERPSTRPWHRASSLPGSEMGKGRKCLPHLPSSLFSPLELSHNVLLILICPRSGLSSLLMSLLNVTRS